MKLKIFKILTVLSFVIITIDTGHIGGQFGIFIILAYFSDFKDILISILFSSILITFLISCFKNLKTKIDLYLFLVGGIVLFIPITKHILFLITKVRSDVIFYITGLIFILFYSYTLFLIRKNRKKI